MPESSREKRRKQIILIYDHAYNLIKKTQATAGLLLRANAVLLLPLWKLFIESGILNNKCEADQSIVFLPIHPLKALLLRWLRF